MRQVFLETVMIAAAAGAGGLVVEMLAQQALTVLAPADLLALSPPNPSNPRVLLFTLAATVTATILFGLMPALRLGGTAALAQQPRRVAGDPPAARRAGRHRGCARVDADLERGRPLAELRAGCRPWTRGSAPTTC